MFSFSQSILCKSSPIEPIDSPITLYLPNRMDNGRRELKLGHGICMGLLKLKLQWTALWLYSFFFIDRESELLQFTEHLQKHAAISVNSRGRWGEGGHPVKTSNWAKGTSYYCVGCCGQLWVRHMFYGRTCDELYHFILRNRPYPP